MSNEAFVTKELLLNEAVASWSARNKIRESLLIRLERMISQNADVTQINQMVRLMNELSAEPVGDLILKQLGILKDSVNTDGKTKGG